MYVQPPFCHTPPRLIIITSFAEGYICFILFVLNMVVWQWGLSRNGFHKSIILIRIGFGDEMISLKARAMLLWLLLLLLMFRKKAD
jgi:hypothetical protein